MHVVLWVCLGLGVVYGCDCDCYLLCLSLLVVVCWLPGVVWFACASMLVLLCWLLISLMFNSVGTCWYMFIIWWLFVVVIF